MQRAKGQIAKCQWQRRLLGLLGAILGRSEGLLGRSWGLSRRFWAFLGRFRGPLGLSCCDLELCWLLAILVVGYFCESASLGPVSHWIICFCWLFSAIGNLGCWPLAISKRGTGTSVRDLARRGTRPCELYEHRKIGKHNKK